MHSDVGGGYPVQDLANIPFYWMIDRAQACGLALDMAYVKQFPGRFNGHLHNSMSVLYRPLGKHLRPIGTMKRARESVHPEALRRLESMSYQPVNLTAYLKTRPKKTS